MDDDFYDTLDEDVYEQGRIQSLSMAIEAMADVNDHTTHELVNACAGVIARVAVQQPDPHKCAQLVGQVLHLMVESIHEQVMEEKSESEVH